MTLCLSKIINLENKTNQKVQKISFLDILFEKGSSKSHLSMEFCTFLSPFCYDFPSQFILVENEEKRLSFVK